jgi:hypothetical protein
METEKQNKNKNKKTSCSNAAILWDMGHTKGRPCPGGIAKGKESKNFNVVICSLYRNEYRNLKLDSATMGRELGKSEEDYITTNWGCNTKFAWK